MAWRSAMWVVCSSRGHRWTYAGGSADIHGYWEECTRCGARRRIRLPLG